MQALAGRFDRPQTYLLPCLTEVVTRLPNGFFPILALVDTDPHPYGTYIPTCVRAPQGYSQPLCLDLRTAETKIRFTVDGSGPWWNEMASFFPIHLKEWREGVKTGHSPGQ